MVSPRCFSSFTLLHPFLILWEGRTFHLFENLVLGSVIAVTFTLLCLLITIRDNYFQAAIDNQFKYSGHNCWTF